MIASPSRNLELVIRTFPELDGLRLRRALQVVLAEGVGVSLLATLQRCPFGVFLEQTQSLGVLRWSRQLTSKLLANLPKTWRPSERDGGWQARCKTHVLLIRRKSMINPRGHDHQIALLQPNADPIVLLAADIKKSAARQDVADLLVLVQVLVEEILDFLLVARQQRGRDLDLVAVLVRALRRDLVDGRQVVREVVVRDAEGGEVGWVDGAAGVVGEALVALRRVLVNCASGGLAVVWRAYGEVVEPVGLHFVWN